MAPNTSDASMVDKETFEEILSTTTIGSILKSSIQTLSSSDNNVIKTTLNNSKLLSTLSTMFANTTSYYLNVTTAQEEICTSPGKAFYSQPTT